MVKILRRKQNIQREKLLTYVCLAASIWPLGHPRSDRHVSNLTINRTRRQDTNTFWQSIEHSYRSPSKAIVFQGAQSTSTGMVYNTGSSPTIRERTGDRIREVWNQSFNYLSFFVMNKVLMPLNVDYRKSHVCLRYVWTFSIR